MTYKYRALKSRYINQIDKVEIIKETDKQVVFSNGHREAKENEYQNYFDSWEDAKQFLLERANSRIEFAKMELHNAKTQLGMIKSMKNDVD